MKRKQLLGMVPFYLLAAIVCIGAAQLGSDAVTAAVDASPVVRYHTMVIDAGHGGIDGGATSCTGVLESAFNLQIAHRLDDLMHLLGYDTVMIRTSDTSIHTSGETIAAQKISDLRERVRIVNETPNAILISIHQNTFSDSRYGGAQVFYGQTEESRGLAQELQILLCKTVNEGSNRQIKKANGVYLMNHINQTGILVECGFLSNPREEALLRDEEYQKKLSCVIASGVSVFLHKT